MAVSDMIKFNNGVGFINAESIILLGNMENIQEVIIPDNGWIIINGYRSTDDIYGTELRIDGRIISNISGELYQSLILPVKKGQVLTWNSYAKGMIYFCTMQF